MMEMGKTHPNITTDKNTEEKYILKNASLHSDVTISHPEKIIWKQPTITKQKLIEYLIQISPFMLPFLENRLLTTIRFPHGVPGESFYQKNCPDYAPSFIHTACHDQINYILCNDLSTLLWLGNQLAIEYHVPFQTVVSNKPLEIVFDLDPPSRDAFHLAIKAALNLKEIFDSFEITSYPKLSGNKGIQVHIPIKRNTLNYNDTRIFTLFVAQYLVEKFPEDFTIERMKKNRGGRLYLDYVQHSEGKTIICPYSTRGTEYATVATPLYWDEVNDKLNMKTFSIPFVLDRLTKVGCPFRDFFNQENPSISKIIATLKEQPG